MINKIISHYRILEELGRGGMGILYKAEDVRLGRFVAVKFLRPEFTLDEDAKTRFTREARAASALDHPNICTVHEIGETDDGRMFIAMAHYDGETLRQKLANIPVNPPSPSAASSPAPPGGFLGMDESLHILIQVAFGLEAAHEAGIVHRDVKPSNIIVTPKGDVKIVDFGLVKLSGDMSRTLTGTTLGTVEYLSPEQAQGFDVDRRSDIWSLGVMAYEMTTGRLPFRGERPLAVIHSILHDEPESVLDRRPDLPPAWGLIVGCALEKDASDRYPAMRDLAMDLEALKNDLSGKIGEKFQLPSGLDAKRRAERLKKRTGKVFTYALLPLIALATGLYGVRILLKNSRPPFRMVPFTTFKGFEAQPAFSPDGKRIAFSWSDSDQRNADIYVKQIGTDQPLRLTRQPASSVFPVWSPDGRRIAFFRYGGGRRSLYAVPAEGGPETRLQTLNPDWKNAATGFAQTADWSPDGRSLVYADMDSARETVCLYRLSLETMKTARITAPPAGILGDFLPRISFDGTRLAFIRFSSYAACDIRILSFVSNDEKRITLDKKYIVGMSWVPGGREIIVSTKQAGNAQLWRVSVSNGTCRMIMPGEQYAFWIDVSRDGRKMAYEKLIAQQNIYRYDIPAEKNRKATSRHVLAFSHIMGHAYFSPDGRRICFFSDRSGNIELWVCRPDETGLLQLTDMSDAGSGTPRWSPDSQWIAFDSRPGGNGDIYVVGADGGPVKRITDAPSDDRIPSWSGDGKWIYFASNRTGMFQIWKVPVQGGDAVQVTTDGGINGFESSDGRWFYYSKLDTREGIWKLSLKSGKTRLLLGEDMMVFNWALGKNGIYYIKSTTGKNQRLQFFNFSSGRSADIAVLDQRDVIMMGVSPDNRSFLYTNAEYQMDIVLVENFR